MKKIITALCLLAVLYSCRKETSISSEEESANSGKKQQALAVTTIQFSGYTWYVKSSGNSKYGPGPNYWTSNNVWVDANGYLHLKINKVKGRWQCAEVWSEQNFGYGSYQWQVEGRVDQLDKNIVLGLFNYSGNDGFDEMDIEFARWGNINNPNLSYTVWPAQQGFNNFSYSKLFSLNGTYTTHRFTSTSNSVNFRSMHGFTNTETNLYTSATCTNPPNSVSTLAMPVHMNFWLFQGKSPSNGKQAEIIIHNFSYQP